MKAKLENIPHLEIKGVELVSENDTERLILERLWNEHGRPVEMGLTPDGSRTLVITPTVEGMNITPELIGKVDKEMDRAIDKWGEHDQIPDNLISAAVEELGEAAHAFNHNEGKEKAQQEVVEAIGVLVRLYGMAEVFIQSPTK